MDRVFVTSSNVKSVGYDRDTSTLEVEFHSGSTYRYRPVEPDVYDDMIDPANSAGGVVAQLKRDPFVGCERVDAEVSADV